MSDSYLRRTVARLVRRPAAVIGLGIVYAVTTLGVPAD